MHEKKIYKILKDWFPQLADREIPAKKRLGKFKHFLWFMKAERSGKRIRSYILKIDYNAYWDNGLEYCSVLQDTNIETNPIQTKIRNQVLPIIEHYEKYKDVIGRYYNLNEQINDIVIRELYSVTQHCEYEMLLICAEHYYWMLVPSDDKKIGKFCKKFNEQFKDESVTVEHYVLGECLSST